MNLNETLQQTLLRNQSNSINTMLLIMNEHQLNIRDYNNRTRRPSVRPFISWRLGSTSNLQNMYTNEQNNNSDFLFRLLISQNYIVSSTYGQLINPIDTICPITRETFELESQVVMICNCRHIFMKESFITLIASSNNCPCCRNNIIPINSINNRDVSGNQDINNTTTIVDNNEDIIMTQLLGNLTTTTTTPF